MSAPYKFISDEEQAAKELEIWRIRKSMSSLTPAEQEIAGERIGSLKMECAANWDARHNQLQGERLTRMGY